MDTIASPSDVEFHADGSLADILAALQPHADKALIIEYAGRTIQAGYHVTEVKAGSFVTLDCGGNPDQWRETILQVEDIPAAEGRDFMKVGKFCAIFAQVATKIKLDSAARLTFEVGTPGIPMQIFDADTVRYSAGEVVLSLAPRPAICKPRHRAIQNAAQAACYGQSANAAKCC